jgi:exodeoxyribonuclease VII large subunit
VTAPLVRDVYTVSRLNREVRMLLDAGLPGLWVEGEISNLSCPASGHWYFTLKDRDAQIRCAMFRMKNQLVRFRPKDGERLVVRGRVSLYEPRGDYQLIAEQMEPAGEGLLKLEYERLKAKLAAEGLFDDSRKRPLPEFPRRIVVVTSATGAAVRDVLHVLARRFPPASVLVIPVPVQGAAAAPAIVAAIDHACGRGDCDVLILARGGGSLEDLWSFNDERVARAIHRAGLPVVTGIGHETDFTIADFVADVRAPTPTGAAQLVAPDRIAVLARVRGALERLALAARRQIHHQAQESRHLERRLAQAHPGAKLQQQAQRLDELEQRIAAAMRRRLREERLRHVQLDQRLQRSHAGQHVARAAEALARLAQRSQVATTQRLAGLAQRLALAQRGLHAVSPLATLTRGFAIVTRADGSVAQDARELAAGDVIEARLASGSFVAVVRDVKP